MDLLEMKLREYGGHFFFHPCGLNCVNVAHFPGFFHMMS